MGSESTTHWSPSVVCGVKCWAREEESCKKVLEKKEDLTKTLFCANSTSHNLALMTFFHPSITYV